MMIFAFAGLLLYDYYLVSKGVQSFLETVRV
jgi:hypothetical protein